MIQLKVNMILKFSIVLLLTTSLTALDNLCSNNVYDKKCLCKRSTNEHTKLPDSIANCYGLDMGKFPEFSQFPGDVTVLDLSKNNFKSLTTSRNNGTSSATLKKLNLSHNGISRIEADFFEGFPALSWLDLSHNNLSSLRDDAFSHQNTLVYLDLSWNNFKKLPSGMFYNLPLLKFLDLSYNPLGAFLMSSKDVLSKTLGISQNISHLRLNNNGVNELNPEYFEPYQTLRHLELQDNTFEYIPTVPYSVEYLDLSGNNLNFVSARYLNYHSVKVLRLCRMPSLVSIYHYAFYNLYSLETLTITDCPNLQEFSDLAFGLASKTMDIHPKTVNLARNGITSLNSTYAHMFRNMQHIDLRHNPWDCTCDILWLKEFSSELYKGNELRCATPSQLKKKQVLKLSHLDMQDCYPEIYGKTSHRVTIVVLMTAVIFLAGIIFYLVRYPRNWVNPKQIIGIGPNSPYSPAPQEDVRY